MNRKVAFVLLLALMLTSLAPALAQDPIEIRFWHAFADENRQGWVREVIDAYMAEHPEVVIVQEPQASYRDTLNGAILAAGQDTAPHIVQVFEVGTQLALDSGVFIPVSSVANADQLASLEDVIDPVASYYSVGEDQWSLPWNSSNPILYYNKDIFAEVGLEEVPTTYSEVLEACDTIMMAGLDLDACIGWNMHSWFVEQWVAEQGALLANNSNGREGTATEIFLESDAMFNIFYWWQELVEKGYYTYTGALEDWNGSDALFTGQRVAMHITSTADLVNLDNAAVESGFKMGTGLLPIADGVERNGVVIGGASIWLVDGHPQNELEAAVDFMIYLGSTENGVTWHQRTGYFPIRYSSIDALTEAGWFEENPEFQTAFDQLTNTVVGYPTSGAVLGNFLELRTIIEEAAQAVVDGGVDPADALAQAQEKADTSLATYLEDQGE